jgi:DNA-3-methyladenine glycosylase
MRLNADFFENDVLWVAENLLGKMLVRQFDDGTVHRYVITDTEAYRGEEDLACHACRGRTKRTEILYHHGGNIYVYLIYGMYWMLNFVTGKTEQPQAVLIRGIEGVDGPGRVGKMLQLDKTFYGENQFTSQRLWVEDAPKTTDFKTGPRIGIDYAGDEWKNKPWRFTLQSKPERSK